MLKEEEYSFTELDNDLCKFKLYLILKAWILLMFKNFIWFAILTLIATLALFFYHQQKPIVYESKLYLKTNFFSAEVAKLIAHEFQTKHDLLDLKIIQAENHHEWFNRLNLMSQVYPQDLRDWVKFQEVVGFQILSKKKEEIPLLQNELILQLEQNNYAQNIAQQLRSKKQIDIEKLEAEILWLEKESLTNQDKQLKLKLSNQKSELKKSKLALENIKNVALLLKTNIKEYNTIKYIQLVALGIGISLITFLFISLFKLSLKQ